MVTETLPAETGALAFRDDGAGMPAPPADYGLRLWIHDIEFAVDVVKPLSGARFTDRLVYLTSI
jgi:hypothetical protein